MATAADPSADSAPVASLVVSLAASLAESLAAAAGGKGLLDGLLDGLLFDALLVLGLLPSNQEDPFVLLVLHAANRGSHSARMINHIHRATTCWR
jgi:hypothetical protein